jgi:hypothetical protein
MNNLKNVLGISLSDSQARVMKASISMPNFKAPSIAALICCVATFAFANTIITDPGPGFLGGTTGNTTLGYDFTVGSSAIELAALGVWDWNQDGLADAHTVSLWDTAGNLLASAAISPGTVNPLVGEFRYATIIPIILSAGTTYVFGATYVDHDADPVIGNVSGDQATFDPAVSPGNARKPTSGGFVFPNDTSAGPGSFVGPNAQFRSVPEPGSTALLLGLAVACLICAHTLREEQRWGQI